MEIQVVAGQVGEDGDVELDAVDTALRQTMARHLHRHRIGAIAA